MASDLVVRVAWEGDAVRVPADAAARADGLALGLSRQHVVREDRRNRGIGSALIGAVIDAANERRCARVVLSPTARSVPFYRRAGFVAADGEAGELMLLRADRRS